VAFAGVKLNPGINVERTPLLLEAGYSASQLIRFRDGLAQKYGGWEKFYPLSVGGVPRDLHAWKDLNQSDHLAIGTTTQFGVITSGVLTSLTPQTVTTNPAPDFSTTNGSPLVTVVDAGVSNVTTFDSVFFNTPVAVTGSSLILSGLYPIEVIVGANSYQIRAASNASATVSNVGAVPAFTTTSGSSTVSVALTAHGLASGGTIVFPISTTGNGVTIDGLYGASSITSANAFTVLASSQASAAGSFSMNGGLAQLVYYITGGPAAAGVGYGLGAYGSGGYGTGIVPSSQTGTPITATDWTTDNWGEILLTCPENGGIYYWEPSGGFTTVSLISSGPIFNSGMFVSTSAQIVVAYGSTIQEDIGVIQDPMLVQWCDSGNFFDWTPSDTNLARNFHIPIGSRIVTGMAVSNQNLIWTDVDLWVMNFIGFPNVYGFNKIGAGAGAASKHSVQQLRGGVYWMGPSNFYRYAGSGVEVIPCPVWDAVFQNLNTDFIQNVRAMPNTGFNEIGWLYPSTASVSGENDSYVKMNISEPGSPWDIGPAGAMPRSAWIDQNVFGPPIATSPGGVIYQHETGNDADGQPMQWSFSTGLFKLAEGETYPVVDQIRPDFKFGEYGQSQGAQIQMTFKIYNFPGDTPVSYGPYTVTQATQFLSTRMRGGLMSIDVSGADLGSFFRLGYVRFRYGEAGRR
jgi:hypothetical protein